MDVHKILMGNEDPALWWLTYVEQMVTEYAKEHRWRLDDDPQATHEAIGVVKEGCQQLRLYLLEREEEAGRSRAREEMATNRYSL